MERIDPLPTKPVVLHKFANRFVDWINDARLEEKTRKFYRNGWRLLKSTPVAMAVISWREKLRAVSHVLFEQSELIFQLPPGRIAHAFAMLSKDVRFNLVCDARLFRRSGRGSETASPPEFRRRRFPAPFPQPCRMTSCRLVLGTVSRDESIEATSRNGISRGLLRRNGRKWFCAGGKNSDCDLVCWFAPAYRGRHGTWWDASPNLEVIPPQKLAQ